MSKSPKEILYQFAQNCIKQLPVIILGSGASAAYGIPGMPKLKEYLLGLALPSTFDPVDNEKWKELHGHLENTDLEAALNSVRLPEAITDFIVKSTWDFLAPYDYNIFENAISKPDMFPLTRLFHHLFSSTHNDIHVVTPNYDRLAEYAADSGDMNHYTGFNHGHIRRRSTAGKPKFFVGKSPARTVNIWKVHGSFDWFRDHDGIVFGLPVGNVRPANLTPVIVTPGVEKYRLTHDEPFHSIKTEADKALQNAESYLCIGYGFNDSHLQTTLIERCRGKEIPLILLTKEISKTAKEFLKSGKCPHYLAIEEAASGCRMFCTEHPEGVEIAGESFWKLDTFLTTISS